MISPTRLRAWEHQRGMLKNLLHCPQCLEEPRMTWTTKSSAWKKLRIFSVACKKIYICIYLFFCTKITIFASSTSGHGIYFPQHLRQTFSLGRNSHGPSMILLMIPTTTPPQKNIFNERHDTLLYQQSILIFF